jgi:hypothetical protein
MAAIDDPTDSQPDLRDQWSAAAGAPVAHRATGAPWSRRRVKEEME